MQQEIKGKVRTREHVIHDLALNHFERHALLCGYSTQRLESSDYGFDMALNSYNSCGEIENGCVWLQFKASDKPRYSGDRTFVSADIERAHLKHWVNEPYPIVLVVYDAKRDQAFWLYVQRYFESKSGFDVRTIGKKYAVRLGSDQIINRDAILKFTVFKNEVLALAEGVIKHV